MRPFSHLQQALVGHKIEFLFFTFPRKWISFSNRSTGGQSLLWPVTGIPIPFMHFQTVLFTASLPAHVLSERCNGPKSLRIFREFCGRNPQDSWTILHPLLAINLEFIRQRDICKHCHWLLVRLLFFLQTSLAFLICGYLCFLYLALWICHFLYLFNFVLLELQE